MRWARKEDLEYVLGIKTILEGVQVVTRSKRLTFGWFIHDELTQLLELDHAVSVNPWSQDKFIQTIRRRECIIFVVRLDDRVAGFLIHELLVGKINLMRFAVAPTMQRQGIGRLMISRSKNKLSLTGARRLLVANVPEEELVPQLFLKSLGFKYVGTVKQATGETFYEMLYRTKVES